MNTKTKTALLSLALAAVACAQPAIAPPQVGFIQDSANSFRPVNGFAANFVLGNPITSNVLSAAFSGSLGLSTTGAALTVTDSKGETVATTAAPAGPALFAFSRTGARALAFFPNAGSLLLWNHGTFEPIPYDQSAFPTSAVQSIAWPDPLHAAFLLERNDEIWAVRILLATGQVDSQFALPGVIAPVLWLATGELVWTDASGIVIRRHDGSETHLAAQIPANFSLQQMGNEWIQGADLAGADQFAIRVTPGHEGFFALPGVQQ